MKCRKYIMLSALTLAAVGCSDTWDDHYEDAQSGGGTQTLLQLVEQNPELSDFKKILDATHVYNNARRTDITYSQLLASDQTLTLWAPVNGSYNADSLLNLCQTVKGDSGVAQHFVTNHISRNLYNMNSRTFDNVKMLNDKFILLSPSALGSSDVVAGSSNIPAKNGLMHVLSKDAPYYYNVYEGLVSLDQYKYMGKYLSSLEQQKLDEESSIVAYIEDGMKVYSDSVLYKYNTLFRVFDNINNEDSVYWVLAPTESDWNKAYAEAEKYFNYGNIDKADSVSSYWTNVSLMRDLIYYGNEKNYLDSLVATSATYAEWPYHVYYKPFSKDGIFTRANIESTLDCSNGTIFNMGSWPFTAKQLYFHPIVMEAEKEELMRNSTLCSFNRRETLDDNISGHRYLDIVPQKSTSNWTAKFEIRNTLSGTYDICAVVLPKTVYMSNSKDTKPNKFVATLEYVDENGKTVSVDYKDQIESSGVNIDTLKIARFTFPTCNYGQTDATVTLTIQCSITSRETRYSREMFLDCIYLRPIDEEDIAAEENKGSEESSASARSRMAAIGKEDNK